MATCSVTDLSETFGSCIEDLNVSELLLLKHSLQNLIKEDCVNGNCAAGGGVEGKETRSGNNEQQPVALALVAEQRGYTDWEQNAWLSDEKPSKLQTLFQISITALAFLSFGGYLLCLIVQGIKSKGTTYLHPTTTGGAGANNNANTGFKRIKVYRRSRRNTLHESRFDRDEPQFEQQDDYYYY